jgi:hypothetical protein
VNAAAQGCDGSETTSNPASLDDDEPPGLHVKARPSGRRGRGRAQAHGRGGTRGLGGRRSVASSRRALVLWPRPDRGPMIEA